MEEFSCKQIKDSESTRSKANREVAKLFLLQYYQDLLRQKLSDGEINTMEGMYDKIVIRYKWIREQKIYCCMSKMQQGMILASYNLFIDTRLIKTYMYIGRYL